MMEDDPEFKKAVGELHEQIIQQIAPHVLIVDDSEEDVIILRHSLMEACPHIHVQWRSNVEEALGFVRAFAFDLVILDLRLGLGMDGVAVFKAIRETSAVPIIGLTGSDGSSSLWQEAKRAGMKVIFQKPLDPEQINVLFGIPGVIRTHEATHNDTH